MPLPLRPAPTTAVTPLTWRPGALGAPEGVWLYRWVLVLSILVVISVPLLWAPAAVAATPPWVPPLPQPLLVVRDYVASPEPWDPAHRGVDLAASPGALIVAAADGTVSFAGSIAGRGVIALDHGGAGDATAPLRTTYEPVVAAVTAGDRVAQGQIIGALEPGSAHCPIGCLHWGVRDLAAERAAMLSGGPYAGASVYRNPMALLNPPRIELLPRLPVPPSRPAATPVVGAVAPRSSPPPRPTTSTPPPVPASEPTQPTSTSTPRSASLSVMHSGGPGSPSNPMRVGIAVTAATGAALTALVVAVTARRRGSRPG